MPSQKDYFERIRRSIEYIDYAFGSWLPQFGHDLAGDYTFEVYRENKPQMELYIPIR